MSTVVVLRFAVVQCSACSAVEWCWKSAQLQTEIKFTQKYSIFDTFSCWWSWCCRTKLLSRRFHCCKSSRKSCYARNFMIMIILEMIFLEGNGSRNISPRWAMCNEKWRKCWCYVTFWPRVVIKLRAGKNWFNKNKKLRKMKFYEKGFEKKLNKKWKWILSLQSSMKIEIISWSASVLRVESLVA